MFMISNQDLGTSFSISKEAFNSICGNPYKFPKPEEIVSTIIVRDKRVPNVSISTSLEHIYSQCVKKLLSEFVRNMRTTYKKLQDSGNAPELKNYKSGHSTVHSTIYISYWQLRCSMTCLNPNLTMEDMEMISGRPDDIGRDFNLEIISATIKPKPKDAVAMRISKKALEGNRDVKMPTNEAQENA